MQSILFTLSLIGLFTLVSATYDPGDLPFPVQEIEFNGTLGGHEVQLNGTVQEMVAQMQVLHPEFDPKSFALAARSEHMSLKSRQVPVGLICYPVPGQNWGGADSYQIADGVSYLWGFQFIGSNPYTCGRISCSWNSAIWLCNGKYNINFPGSDFAWYAQDIIDHCGWDDSDGPKTGGQAFDNADFNIIVRSDNC